MSAQISDELNVYTPEQSQAFLEGLGYTPDTWDKIIHRDHASHQVRALIHVARAQEPQNLVEVYRQLYPNEPLHWLKPRTGEDVAAEKASDEAWGKLTPSS